MKRKEKKRERGRGKKRKRKRKKKRKRRRRRKKKRKRKMTRRRSRRSRVLALRRACVRRMTLLPATPKVLLLLRLRTLSSLRLGPTRRRGRKWPNVNRSHPTLRTLWSGERVPPKPR